MILETEQIKMDYRIITNPILKRIGIIIRKDFPRASIRFINKYYPCKKLVGIEIGTFDGWNALSILRNLNIKKLYLIDPYFTYQDFEEFVNGQEYLNKREKQAHKLLRKYKSKIVWIKDTSDNALKLIKERADFIYIDGNHKYKFVKKDINNYYKILKSKGILAGHDIENGLMPHEGVTKAVLEFINKFKLKLYIQAPDWWVIKK